MVAAIVFIISSITFRNFCLYYSRSLSADATCFVSDSED
jgi:hypothetical protein